MQWDAGHVYSVPQGLRAAGGAAEGSRLTPSDVEEKTKQFIRDFRVGTVFIYRERLLNNAQQGRYHLEIDLEHLKNFSEELHDIITKQPAQYLENVRQLQLQCSKPLCALALALHTHTHTHATPPTRTRHCCPAAAALLPCRWRRARATF